jgi:hypothetical protein
VRGGHCMDKNQPVAEEEVIRRVSEIMFRIRGQNKEFIFKHLITTLFSNF